MEIKGCIIKIIITREPLTQEFLKQVANNNCFQLFNDGDPFVIKELNERKHVKIVNFSVNPSVRYVQK